MEGSAKLSKSAKFPSLPIIQSQLHGQAHVLIACTMAQRTAVKTTYEIGRTLQPIYSGGSVALSADGRILAACVVEDVLLTDLTTGKELARIEGVRFFFLIWIYANNIRMER